LDTIVKDNDYSKDTMTATTKTLMEENFTNKIENEEIATLTAPSKKSPIIHQSTTTGQNSDSVDVNHHLERLWGSSGTASTASSATLTAITESLGEKTIDKNANVDDTEHMIIDEGTQHRRWGRATQQSTLSPKGSNIESHINPPEGFTITARVYIDDKDKLTHFDVIDIDGENNTKTGHKRKQNSGNNGIMLPFYDCGVFGSTTAALPVKQIYFRHSLSSPTTAYIDQSSNENNLVLHPVLAVALSPLTVELDSGEHMEFVAGDVILFEDTIRPGHILTVSQESKSLTVLLVTLPNKHHHIGKQYLSIKAALTVQQQKSAPCRTATSNCSDRDKTKFESKTGDQDVEMQSMSNSNLDTPNALFSFRASGTNSSPSIFSDGDRQMRLFLFGTVAFSLSTLMADFLGRTAPLWLAVGVGGTCFVIGSTYAITMSSDYIYTSFTLWHERRKLERKRGKSTNNNDQSNL
jgi:hypothetical protein